MKSTEESATRAALFLAGVAVLIFVLDFVLMFPRTAILNGKAEGLLIGSHSFNWILFIPAYLTYASIVMLAALAGHLLRRRFPNPSRVLTTLLWILSAVGVLLFMAGSDYLPMRYSWGALFCAAVCGYLVKIPEVDGFRTKEALVMTLLSAAMFVGLFILPRHRWLMLPAALSFSYYMMILAYSPTVQRCLSVHRNNQQSAPDGD